MLNPLDKHYSYYDQFEVEQTVTYGANAIILNSGIGFFDTLKTFILIASDAFQVYQKATGAVLDKFVDKYLSEVCRYSCFSLQENWPPYDY